MIPTNLTMAAAALAAVVTDMVPENWLKRFEAQHGRNPSVVAEWQMFRDHHNWIDTYPPGWSEHHYMLRDLLSATTEEQALEIGQRHNLSRSMVLALRANQIHEDRTPYPQAFLDTIVPRIQAWEAALDAEIYRITYGQSLPEALAPEWTAYLDAQGESHHYPADRLRTALRTALWPTVQQEYLGTAERSEP